MPINQMTQADVPAVERLINQLHPDAPGVVDPTKVRQGWRAFVARNDSGDAIGFLLGSFFDYVLSHESAGTLEQLVVDETDRGRGIGRELVAEWQRWLLDEGVPLGFTSAGTGEVEFYESCGFSLCRGPWLVWSSTHA
jgi:GNAT superfamily N-acetyltransferase